MAPVAPLCVRHCVILKPAKRKLAMCLIVTDATHCIYCRVLRLEVQRTARHQKRKNHNFLHSLTRGISQTNEPIVKILRKVGDQVIIYVFDGNIWHRANRKNVTLGGNFKIPPPISPKPRIGGSKKFHGLMGHYNRSLPLKFHHDLMNRRSIAARGRKIFNRKQLENEP
jgi:hypothetical protein